MALGHAKLRGKIVEKYGNQKMFAEALKISENWVSMKLNEKSPFSKTDMENWAAALEIPSTEIYDYFFV